MSANRTCIDRMPSTGAWGWLLWLVCLCGAWPSTAEAVVGASVGRDYWVNNCVSCHAPFPVTGGNFPPQISADGRSGLTTLTGKLGNCMDSLANFRKKMAGDAACHSPAGALAGAMTTLSTADAATVTSVWNYLLAVRDGQVSTGTLNLGTVTVGSSASTTVTVTNERYLALTMSGLASSLGNGFTVSSGPGDGCTVGGPTTLTGLGNSCTVTVTYTANNAHSGTLTSGALAVNLAPTGTDPALVSKSIAFTATVNHAPTASASAPATALQGSTVTLNGSDSNDTDTGQTATLSYAWTLTRPDASTTSLSGVSPTFVASSVGTYSATLVVTDSQGVASAASAPVVVVVTAPAARVDLSAASISGFSARVNSGTDQQDLTVCNGTRVAGSCTATGATANLVFNASAFAFTGPFSRGSSSTCGNGASLAPGNACVLQLVYTPVAVGPTVGAQLVIGHSAGSSTVLLSGSGTQSQMSAAVTSSPATPDVQTGLSTLMTVTVANTGTATLGFTSDPQATARLTGNAAFSIVSGGTCNSASTLAAPVTPATTGGSCTVLVRFLPTAEGNGQTASLSLPSNAGNSPVSVTLSGNGVALPPMQASPVTLSFPDTAFGDTSAPQSVTLRNDRASTVSYTLDLQGNADFVVVDDGSGACPGRTLPAKAGANAGQCTVQLAFRPQTTGGATTRNLTLQLRFTAPAGEPTPSAIPITLGGTAKLALRPSLTDVTLNAVATTTTATATVALSNQSAASITLGSLSLGGSGASVFSIDPSSTCAAALVRAPGASCLVVLRYSPTQEGTQDATLTVAHGAPGNPVSVSVRGTATARPQGRLEVDAPAGTLDFSDTQLAATSSRTLLLHNAGNQVLAFSAFELSGAAATDYTVNTTAAGSCSLSVPLAIHGDCQLTLSLRPGVLGARSATLTLRSDGSNPALSVGLSGNGIPVPVPVLGFLAAAPTDTALDFGAQTLGGIYPARSLRVRNAGTAALRISAVSVSGTGFSLVDASDCAADLAPQASCSVSIGFAPTAAGQAFAGTLRVTSNAAGSPHSFDLRGSGVAFVVPVLAWAAPAGDQQFDNVSAGSVSATRSLTLRNLGPGGATLGQMSAVGLDAAVFLVGTDDAIDAAACRNGRLLLEGESCRVDLRFVPGASGPQRAGLQVQSTGSAPAAVQLLGTGLASARASLQLSGTALDFGSTRAGAQSLPLALVLSSPEGAATVRVTALAVSGPFQIVGGNCPALPFPLAAGSSCTLQLAHLPLDQGTGAGSLQVTSDAGAAQVVALQGRGEAAPAVSGGGCSLVDGQEPAEDPTLWALVLLAAAALGWRRQLRRRAAAQPADRP